MALSSDDIVQATSSTIEPVPGIVAPAPATASTRIVTGRIAAAGTVTAGTGFTVSRSAAGSYTVTLATTFGTVPAVVATPNADARFVAVINLAAGSFDVRLRDTAVNLTDSDFTFVATGVV